MSQGNRPGGLTALAVINFVLSGLSLSIFGLVALLSMVFQITDVQESIKVVSIVFSLLTAVLLIVSGVGYLKQKKKLGFLCGNLYAIISIVGSVVGIMTLGFQIVSVIDFIYPLFTLGLLNTIFKEDFINP